MECVNFTYEEKYIKDFIKLPKMLYGKDLMEDADNIRQLLLDKHVLSSYFKLDKFLIYDKGRCAGRFGITTYENDENAYLGFYECIDDQNVAAFLFSKAQEYAQKKGYHHIIGPVDGSFWNKYRLKINLFDKRPYTGEPYNKAYYYKQFTDNGYSVCEHYVSSIYDSFDKEYKNEKYMARYQSFINNGYEIKKLDINDFDRTIEELYHLLTRLYADFPMYKHISKDDFISTFSGYKQILNTDMVRFAYYEGEMAGFFISVPDYGNLVYNLNPFRILKVLGIKKRPEQYVMLYMGVSNEHAGLGSALGQSIIMELQESGLTAIGALARDGKITQGYAKEAIIQRYEYVLLDKHI